LANAIIILLLREFTDNYDRFPKWDLNNSYPMQYTGTEGNKQEQGHYGFPYYNMKTVTERESEMNIIAS
jgi:hypothetical protein